MYEALLGNLLKELKITLKSTPDKTLLLKIARDFLLAINIIIAEKPKDTYQALRVSRGFIAHLFFLLYFNKEIDPFAIEEHWLFFEALLNDFEMDGFQKKTIPRAENQLTAIEKLELFFNGLEKLKSIPSTTDALYEYLDVIYALAELIEENNKNPVFHFSDIFTPLLDKINTLRILLEHDIFETCEKITSLSKKEAYLAWVLKIISDGHYTFTSKKDHQKYTLSFLKTEDENLIQELQVKLLHQLDTLLKEKNSGLVTKYFYSDSINALLNKIGELKQLHQGLLYYSKPECSLIFNPSYHSNMFRLKNDIDKMILTINTDPDFILIKKNLHNSTIFYFEIEKIQKIIFDIDQLVRHTKKEIEENKKKYTIMNPHDLARIFFYEGTYITITHENGNQTETKEVDISSLRDPERLKSIFAMDIEGAKKFILYCVTNYHILLLANNSPSEIESKKQKLHQLLFEIFDIRTLYKNDPKSLLYILWKINDITIFKLVITKNLIDLNTNVYVGSLNPSDDPKDQIETDSLFGYMFVYFYPAALLLTLLASPHFNPARTVDDRPVSFAIIGTFTLETVKHTFTIEKPYHKQFCRESPCYTQEQGRDFLLALFKNPLMHDINLKDSNGHTFLHHLLNRLLIESGSLKNLREQFQTAYLVSMLDTLIKEKKEILDFKLINDIGESFYTFTFRTDRFDIFLRIFDVFENRCLETLQNPPYQKNNILRLQQFFAKKISFVIGIPYADPKGRTSYDKEKYNYKIVATNLQIFQKNIPPLSRPITISFDKAITAIMNQKYTLIEFLERSMEYLNFSFRDYLLSLSSDQKDQTEISAVLQNLLVEKIPNGQYQFAKAILPRLKRLEALLEKAQELIKLQERLATIQNIKNSGYSDGAFFSLPANNIITLQNNINEKTEEIMQAAATALGKNNKKTKNDNTQPSVVRMIT